MDDNEEKEEEKEEVEVTGYVENKRSVIEGKKQRWINLKHPDYLTCQFLPLNANGTKYKCYHCERQLYKPGKNKFVVL